MNAHAEPLRSIQFQIALHAHSQSQCSKVRLLIFLFIFYLLIKATVFHSEEEEFYNNNNKSQNVPGADIIRRSNIEAVALTCIKKKRLDS